MKTPLLSWTWLKYLGIIAFILLLYVLGLFYYHYADEIFHKSLSVEQHLQLAILSIGSQLNFMLFPLLFFSSALIYRLVRKKGLHPLKSIKSDLIVLLPLGILIWGFTAFLEAPVKGSFYAMVFDVQQLEAGERLEEDNYTYELLREPNLNGLHDQVDTLEAHFDLARENFINHLVQHTPPDKVEHILEKLDGGVLQIKLKDLQKSNLKWDGVERDELMILESLFFQESYIESFRAQQDIIRSQINKIHFTPLYIILFSLLGMLLGYLIPLHKIVFVAILAVTGYGWYFLTGIVEATYMTYMNEFLFVLGKIGLLAIVNGTLFLVANGVRKKQLSDIKLEL